jgi:hypothetical protein
MLENAKTLSLWLFMLSATTLLWLLELSFTIKF